LDDQRPMKGYLSDMTSNGVLLDVTDIAKNK